MSRRMCHWSITNISEGSVEWEKENAEENSTGVPRKPIKAENPV